MDARELTKKVYVLDNTICELKAKVEHLEQENRLLNMHVQDLLVDVKMLQNQGGKHNG